MKVDIRQQRAYDCPLRCPCFSTFPLPHRLHDRLLQVPFDESEHPSVRDFLLHFFREDSMVDRVEVLLDVGVYHPTVSFVQKLLNPAQRVFTASLWPEPVTLFGELLLEDRLQDISESRLYHTVSDGGDPEGSGFPFSFRYLYSSHWLHLVPVGF